MDSIYLNIGCGSRKLPGFVNIDLEPGADVRLDVRNGLPYDSSSVQGIFCEHFIEHLSQAEAVAFLRECRRVLVNGGVMRVATPDLKDVVANYHDENWREQPWLKQFGLDWIDNRCELLNTAMREWGHQWIYDEEELVRLALIAGFANPRRCSIGESEYEQFRGREWRAESTLIIEFHKDRPAVREDDPLVSVLIAAYNPKFFRQSLESALDQTYENLEIVVSDDCPDESIGNIVSDYKSDKRIRYIRNKPALGAGGNLLRCFDIARGEYIKYLNDDDFLHPNCVERMVRCLNAYPDVTLVTSHRDLIDENGAYLGEIGSTTRLVAEDSIIEGSSLANMLLTSGLNFIGEPTTAMYRKRDLEGIKPDICSFAGRLGIWNADVMMWINLLSRGDAIYLVDTLSCFRMHSGQQSADEESKRKGLEAWQVLRFDGKRMGLLKSTSAGIVARPLRAEVNSSVDMVGVQVSIVIPVFNQVDFTRKCLEILYRNTPESPVFEVIVVDNGSTDDTAAFLKEAMDRYPRLRTVHNDRNLGFSKACNQGAGEAEGKYVLFLNNDTEVQRGWLEALVGVMEGDPCAAAAGSKLIRPDRTIDNAGIVITDHHQAKDPLLPLPIFAGEPASHLQASQPRLYQALTGACLLVRKSCFEAVGGFDEGYWNGYEDVDLCFKYQEQGWHMVYVPQSVVVHYVSQSGSERFRKAQENIKRLHEKWLGKVTPDITIDGSGQIIQGRAGRIKAYSIPSHLNYPSILNVKVSVVIPVMNQAHFTKLCIKTLLDDDHPKDIIIVDNGSTDETPELVNEYPEIKYIRNDSNQGFAAACNQGIRAASGDYVMLLNNDTLMPKGTIERMLICAQSDSSIGLVAPMSNFVRGLQVVSGCDKPEDYQKFADRLAAEHRGEWRPFLFVAGLCLLIKREVIEKVGLLDESYGIGNYEDDDYCLRSHLAGFRNIVAGDAFVYHFGSQTFKSSSVDYDKLLQENFEKFLAKWGSVELIRPRLTTDLVVFGIKHGEAGDYEKALDFFRRALDFTPENGEALKNMGICLANLGWLQDAVLTLSRYVELYPDDSEGRDLLKQCRQVAGRVVAEHIGRNAPCPCGSGKKYKKCCLRKEGAAQAA